MSLPSYPEYKDSGVAWLGRVPIHWDVQRFKWLIERNDGGVWGDDPDGDDDTFVLRSTEQTVDGRWQIDEPAKRKLAERDRQSALLEVGDLLLTKSSGSALHIGKTTLVDEDVASLGACYSNFMQRLRVNDDFCPKLAWYILNNGLARVQLDLLSNSTTGLANLNGTIIGELLLAQPPHYEQTAIATFLDRETGKIDALIAEQEELLALLAEKRQATISHAVTKGLNPDAPMKDSGVAWLGEVPGHWLVGKAGFYISVLPGYAFSSTGFSLDENNVKLLRGINVGVGELRWDEVVYWSRTEDDGLEAFELHNGDVVIGMDRPLISTGMRVAIVKSHDLPCLLLQRVAKIQAGPSIDRRFIMRLLCSRAFEAHFAPDTTGVSVPHISGEQILNFVIPVPPLGEQWRICEFLESELAKIDALNFESERAIALLKERRSALIAAAVTGQVDVRGLVTEPEAA